MFLLYLVYCDLGFGDINGLSKDKRWELDTPLSNYFDFMPSFTVH
jgi:hypothetical protein